MSRLSVSITALCGLLGGAGQDPISATHVSRLVAAGMPKAERGLYDANACMHWYLGRLRNSVRRREKENADGSSTSLEDERRRLTAAQANMQELDLQERIGRLIPLEIYEQRNAKFAETVKTALLNLPARLAGRLEGMTRPEMKAFISVAVRECLRELANNGKAPAKPTVKRTRKTG